MRKIAVVTVGRSDYGIFRPLLRRLYDSPSCEVQLIAGGMHFQECQGASIDEVTEDGFSLAAEIRTPARSDDASGITEAFSHGVRGMGESFERLKPDLVVLLGDRFETFAAAVAAVFQQKPIAHLHGGELTAGAMDDVMRHSITKMSHLHFASAEIYARRIIQMGEEPWRVHVSGALAIDNVRHLKLLSFTKLQENLGFEFEGAPLVVTYHPPTLENIDLRCFADQFIESLLATGRTIVITAPNADPGGHLLHQLFSKSAVDNQRIHFIENLGTLRYFSLMKYSAAMAGNSSSGILEAASFGLPVVNIGSRQEGRLHTDNVINCGNSRTEIDEAIRLSLSAGFKNTLSSLINPHGTGHSAESISNVLLGVELDDRILRKKFVDLQHN